MSDLTALWRGARGVYQDGGRDGVPAGYVWDLVDYVPEILGAPIRGRGRWTYASTALTNAADTLGFAPFKSQPHILIPSGTRLDALRLSDNAIVNPGTIVAMIAKMAFHRDRAILPAGSGAAAAKFVTLSGTTFTLTDAPVSAIQGKFADVFKDRVLLASSTAADTTVAFSKPGDPTVAWDSLSKISTSLPLTGIKAQRSQVLCFHASAVERIRGTTPPDSTASDPTGDMTLDTLFDLAGCYDARSIVSWNDNVVFADARGVHITDGAIVRNMAEQGGILSKWRYDFAENASRGAVASVSAEAFRNYYIVTLRNVSGPPITWACEIATRRWFRFSNMNFLGYALVTGTKETLYAAEPSTKRLVAFTEVFAPDNTIVQTDGNTTDVLPQMETGFLRLGKAEGFRRILEVFISYEAWKATTADAIQVEYLSGPTDTSYQSLGFLKQSLVYIRRKIFVRRRLLGITLRLTAVTPTKDIRLYDISARVNTEEASKI